MINAWFSIVIILMKIKKHPLYQDQLRIRDISNIAVTDMPTIPLNHNCNKILTSYQKMISIRKTSTQDHKLKLIIDDLECGN